jgi:hypothetical protein
MKIKFDGSPEELAQLLRTFMSGRVGMDLDAVFPAGAPVVPPLEPQEQDGTEAFAKGSTMWSATEVEQDLLMQFGNAYIIEAEPQERLDVVRQFFLNYTFIKAIEKYGGVYQALVANGWTPDGEYPGFATEQLPKPHLWDVASTVVTLAGLDNLLPDNCRAASVERPPDAVRAVQ